MISVRFHSSLDESVEIHTQVYVFINALIVQCYAMLFNVMLCHVMFCHVMLCLPSVCAIVFFCNGPRNNKDNTFVLKKINTNAYLDFHIKDTRCAHWLVTWNSIWTICLILLPFLHACIINAYYVMVLQTFFVNGWIDLSHLHSNKFVINVINDWDRAYLTALRILKYVICPRNCFQII